MSNWVIFDPFNPFLSIMNHLWTFWTFNVVALIDFVTTIQIRTPKLDWIFWLKLKFDLINNNLNSTGNVINIFGGWENGRPFYVTQKPTCQHIIFFSYYVEWTYFFYLKASLSISNWSFRCLSFSAWFRSPRRTELLVSLKLNKKRSSICFYAKVPPSPRIRRLAKRWKEEIGFK